jgi:Transmembrane Fragile-X-F protein
VSASQQFQAKGFYMSGCVSLVLAALKLTEMKSWSWWRVFLPFWVIVGQNVIYVCRFHIYRDPWRISCLVRGAT